MWKRSELWYESTPFTAPFLLPYLLSPISSYPILSPSYFLQCQLGTVISLFLLLRFSLHPVPYFRHASEVPNVPAHLHSFHCISHLSHLGKQRAALSTSLSEIPRGQNLPPIRLPNSPKQSFIHMCSAEKC